MSKQTQTKFREEYKAIKFDRHMDYSGLNIDGIAHYASRYRETRSVLESIIKTAKRNPDGTYSYKTLDEKDMNIPEESYQEFQIRDNWTENNKNGTLALTKVEAITTAKTFEVFLKSKGLV